MGTSRNAAARDAETAVPGGTAAASATASASATDAEAAPASATGAESAGTAAAAGGSHSSKATDRPHTTDATDRPDTTDATDRPGAKDAADAADRPYPKEATGLWSTGETGDTRATELRAAGRPPAFPGPGGPAQPLVAGTPAAAARGRHLLRRYGGPVLRTTMWLVRAVAVVLVGISVFAQPPHGPAAFPIIVATYALSVAAIAAWVLLDVFPGLTRRHPLWLPGTVGVLAVAAGAGCTVRNAGEMVALACMATVEAGSWTRLASGWTVLGAGVLSVAVGTLAGDLDRAGAIGYPLLLLVGLLVGHNRRSLRVQAEQSAAMVDQVERLRTEQRRVAVLDERTRIAREIHDVLAHSLGALGIQIQAARALLADGTEEGKAEQADGVLAVAQRIASDGLAETRRAVHALRADTPPLDEELARMAAVHEERHGAPVATGVTGRRFALAAEPALALVRTAQESLVNAAKHAPRQPVTVRLDYGDDDVTLTVSNPLGASGSGDFATLDSGYGLTGMRERLLLLGGTLTAGPAADDDAGRGAGNADGGSTGQARADRWTVTARVPR